MEYIYLNPGNWFELKNISKDTTFPFDIETFKNEILNQVNDRSEKLSFIDLSFGKKYHKTTITNIEFYLDQEKFTNMANMISNESRHPIITFHGTSKAAVESILASGYIIPGQNSNVKNKHGTAFGIGIYSSPFFDKAVYYTIPDNDKNIYVLINIVMLGKMKLGNSFKSNDRPKNGTYSDGSNTNVVYGLDQLISADPTRIIPVAIMEIKINKN